VPAPRFSAALTVLIVAAAAPVVAPGPARAVTGGQPDGAAHPYAVGIVEPGQTGIGCSGVLVRPRAGGPPVVLTAAHCLARFGSRGTVHVVFGAGASTGSRPLAGVYQVNPAYRPTDHLHDIAVVRLGVPAPTAPATLAPIGTLDRVSPGSLVTLGFGAPFHGQRRSATELLVSVTPDWVFLRQGSGNSCSGDSGGPDLLPGSSTVVALTDQGSCSDSQDLRLDTATSQSFIARAAGVEVHAQLSRSQVPAWGSVALHVTTSPHVAGRRALRQGWYDGAWHTWASALTSANGTVTFTIRPTVRTTDHYRVLIPAASGSNGGVSETRDLLVT